MANYNQLKASISAVIKSNNRNEITGQILQNVLNQMVGVIGENYQLAGFATPLTNPGAPDQNVFYVADQGGAYVNFDNIVLDAGLSFLMWKNSQWTSHTVNIVTAERVEQNYVSIDFFRSLFRAYDVNDDEILPNNPADPITEEQTVVDSIKAMVGFWTEQYISALGHGTGGGGGGGGGGATVLDDLLDVTITNPLAGQGLIYNGTKWVNQAIPTGTDMSSVWAALSANTAEQINISHLSTALTDYATQSWVNQNFITIAYFDRLFRAYNGSTLVSHNDTTSTIDNIKAMFGFWTDFYVSALGTGGMQSPIGLASLNDVALTSPISDGQVLQYNQSTGKWTNATLSLTTTLGGLTDVLISTPSYGDVLLYDGTKWINSALKTVNGNSLIGSGDINVGGGAGQYLPLSGGTLSNYNYGGCLTINRSAGSGYDSVVNYTNSGGLLGRIGCRYNGEPIYVNSSGNEYVLYHTGNLSNSGFLQTTGGTMTGDITLSNDIGISFTQISTGLNSDRGIPFGIYGYFNKIAYVSNAFTFNPRTNRLKAGGLTLSSGNLILDGQQDYSSTGGATQIVFGKNGTEHCVISSNKGYIVINPSTSSNTGSIALCCEINGQSYIQSNLAVGGTTASYDLHVYGTIYATGNVTALSDIRKKDERGMVGLSVEQIAGAPAVQFTWKGERAQEGLQVGTYAQYWQGVLPEVVMDKGGELSMQYGVAALVSAIVTARKVVDHERRITELERENERLKTEIEQLRLN